MGFVSVIIVRHDNLSDIENNPAAFGREMAQAVQDRFSRLGPTNILGGAAEVIGHTHSHDPLRVLVHNNTAEVEKESAALVGRERDFAKLLELMMEENVKKNGRDSLNSEFMELVRVAVLRLPASSSRRNDLIGRLVINASK